MRIISLNCNGIRSAHSKGLHTWLSRQRADVVCLQETKAQVDQLDKPLRAPRGWHIAFRDAVKKGYSGVAIMSRHEPDAVHDTLGWPGNDDEGRYIQMDFGALSVISLYMPSGSSSEERQAAKFEYMKKFLPLLKKWAASEREYVICGDWNIAHKQIDLRNWRSNQKNSGFLPEEREWMDEVFGSVGLCDAFRLFNPEPDQYTWWSNRGQAWAKNVGWRIDYQVTTPKLAKQVTGASIYKRKRFSDHAPLILDYDTEVSDFR